MMKIKSSFFMLVFMLGLKVQAQDTLTVQQAIALALQNNYSIIIASNEALIAEKNNTLGNAGFLPNVSANFSQTNNVNNTKQQFFSGDTREGKGVNSNSLNANIQMNWTVFDGMSMFVNRQKLGEFEAIGELNSRIQIEKTVSQVIVAYYDIVQRQKQIAAIRNAIEISAERKKISEERLSIGSGSGLELLQAQVDINADSSALLRQEYALANSKIVLNELLARIPETSFLVSGKIELQQGLVYDELLQKVTAQNPEIAIAKRNATIAALNQKQTRSNYLPGVSLNSGYTFSRSTSEIGILQYSQNSGINYGLTARWTIFNGLENKRLTQVAKINSSNLENQRLQTELRIKSDLYQIYTAYLSYSNLQRIEKENLGVANQNLFIATEKMRIGTISAIELREAQRNLVDAEFRLVMTEYEAKLAETELLRLSGQLVK